MLTSITLRPLVLGWLLLGAGACGTPRLAGVATSAALESSASAPAPGPQEERAAEPDFLGYFPDDPEGGAALDALWEADGQGRLSVDEWAAVVRRGLRHTQVRPLFFLRDLGNRGVWGKPDQNAAAKELMFHAADWKAGAPGGEVQHSAVYFGLSVIEPKDERVLGALASICLYSDDPNTIGRIAWGASDHAERLVELLAPALEGDDEALRTKAEELVPILRGEDEAFAWARRKAKARAQRLYAKQLPDLLLVLREGGSAERLETLRLFQSESLMLITPDDAIEVFSVCANDADPRVRREVARLAGNHWVWMRVEEPASAVDLMMKLSADPDPQVRYDAVYYGLSTVDADREDVTRRMVELLLDGPQSDLGSRLTWGLRGREADAGEALIELIDVGTGERALAAYELYERLLGRPAPVRPDGLPEVASLLGDWTWTVRLPGGRQAQQEVTIERVAEGSDDLVVTLAGTRFPVAASAFQGRELLFVFTGNMQGSQFHTTARLRDGELVGSTHVLGEGVLLPWTGRRR
jgi:hypothetical protein